jgi:ABC-2 type transport system ATP-binding protein
MSTTVLPRAEEGRVGTSDWAVEAHGLVKRFGTNVAVNNVDLRIPRGCAFGYLGPNGAGKTTLIRVLLGLTDADAGSMSLLGYEVPRDRAKALTRVGAIVDEPRFHAHLTGRQNLALLASSREPAATGRIGPSLERVGLTHRANDRVSKYSMGMRQRLGVAACLLADPQLLILDEPMNGLDPAGMQDIREMVLALVDRGTVIRQGPIADLLAGTSVVLEVECSDPERGQVLVAGINVSAQVAVNESGLAITLPAGSGREVIAEISRVLMEGGLHLYRLQPVQTSLESWFLQVTSRLGASE